MKNSILVLLLCALAGFAFVSCTPEPAVEPELPPEEPVTPPEVLYAGKVYNQTSKTAYEGLALAVSAARDGDYIVMYKDETFDQSFLIDKSLTLDLNGHTIHAAVLHTADEVNINTGSINIAGELDKHLERVALLNGTITGAYSGSKASGAVVRGYLVEDLYLENISIIGTASVSTDKQSLSLYAAFCNVTINNNFTNVFKGHISVYDKLERKVEEGYMRTSFVIDGGVYTKDMDSSDPMVIRFSCSNGSVPTLIQNAHFAEGTFSKASSDSTSVAALTIRQGMYCFNPTAYVDSEKYNITGTYIVSAK